MTTESLVLRRGTDSAAIRNACIVVALFAVAVLTRAGRIGDPTIHVDEQFYLLVADRMWHGALPYVDIWDRKPILLFLIYAALRPFSPDGIVAYQIGALLFATATAYFVVLIASRFANTTGALLAGIAYLLYLPVLGGAGGQSPVFYNLFMAIGAWEVIRAGEANNDAGIWRHGLRAMLWAGLAIQVKYTAAIDGMAFGLWLIVLLIRRNEAPARIVGRAAVWALAALAPTLIAAGFYVLIGHGWEFWQANFLSTLQKQQPSSFPTLLFLGTSTLELMALIVLAMFSIGLLISRKAITPPTSFLLLWAMFSVADFFALGNYYDHYALPLLVPATIVCAPILETAVGGTVGMALFAWFTYQFIGFPTNGFRQFDQMRIAAMVDAARPYAAHGCIYINDGPPILYHLTHSCLPTRYAFPEHLNDAAEADATDATRSMSAMLASRPSAIFVSDGYTRQTRNLVTAAMLNAALASDYQRVATFQDVYPERQQLLYVRKDLLPPGATRP
jgi:Dolichyl-phosphate-mannose-protein mannosyltransferase